MLLVSALAGRGELKRHDDTGRLFFVPACLCCALSIPEPAFQAGVELFSVLPKQPSLKGSRDHFAARQLYVGRGGRRVGIWSSNLAGTCDFCSDTGCIDFDLPAKGHRADFRLFGTGATGREFMSRM